VQIKIKPIQKHVEITGSFSILVKELVICSMMACSITGLIDFLGHQFQIQRSTLGTHSVLAAHSLTAMLAI
jgi:hypothetical protein